MKTKLKRKVKDRLTAMFHNYPHMTARSQKVKPLLSSMIEKIVDEEYPEENAVRRMALRVELIANIESLILELGPTGNKLN